MLCLATPSFLGPLQALASPGLFPREGFWSRQVAGSLPLPLDGEASVDFKVVASSSAGLAARFLLAGVEGAPTLEEEASEAARRRLRRGSGAGSWLAEAVASLLVGEIIGQVVIGSVIPFLKATGAKLRL